MKPTATIIPLMSLVMAASAKEQLSASRLRRRQLREALLANLADPDDETDRALAAEEMDLTDLMTATPCLEYSFEGHFELPDDDPCSPTKAPSKAPTKSPTDGPTNMPSKAPTQKPTEGPTNAPSENPTKEPTDGPTNAPSKAPTKEPTEGLTGSPSKAPTPEPTPLPTNALVEPVHTPEPTSKPTPTPTRKTKQADDMPIPVPQPCCSTCYCFNDDDYDDHDSVGSDSHHSWGSGSKSSKSSSSSSSSKSSKGSKSSKSAYVYSGDTSAIMRSEMLAFKDAQNSAHHSQQLSTVLVTVAAAVAINALR